MQNVESGLKILDVLSLSDECIDSMIVGKQFVRLNDFAEAYTLYQLQLVPL